MRSVVNSLCLIGYFPGEFGLFLTLDRSADVPSFAYGHNASSYQGIQPVFLDDSTVGAVAVIGVMRREYPETVARMVEFGDPSRADRLDAAALLARADQTGIYLDVAAGPARIAELVATDDRHFVAIDDLHQPTETARATGIRVMPTRHILNRPFGEQRPGDMVGTFAPMRGQVRYGPDGVRIGLTEATVNQRLGRLTGLGPPPITRAGDEAGDYLEVAGLLDAMRAGDQATIYAEVVDEVRPQEYYATKYADGIAMWHFADGRAAAAVLPAMYRSLRVVTPAPDTAALTETGGLLGTIPSLRDLTALDPPRLDDLRVFPLTVDVPAFDLDMDLDLDDLNDLGDLDLNDLDLDPNGLDLNGLELNDIDLNDIDLDDLDLDDIDLNNPADHAEDDLFEWSPAETGMVFLEPTVGTPPDRWTATADSAEFEDAGLMVNPIEALRRQFQPETYYQWKLLHRAWRQIAFEGHDEPTLTRALVVDAIWPLRDRLGLTEEQADQRRLTEPLLRAIEEDSGNEPYTFAYADSTRAVVRRDQKYREWQADLSTWLAGGAGEPPALTPEIVMSALPTIMAQQQITPPLFPLLRLTTSVPLIGSREVWALLEANGLTLDSYRTHRPRMGRPIVIEAGTVRARAALPDPFQEPVEALRQGYVPRTYEEWRVLHRAWRASDEFVLPEPELTLFLVFERQRALLGGASSEVTAETVSVTTLRAIERENGLEDSTFIFLRQNNHVFGVERREARYERWRARVLEWRLGLSEEGPPALDAEVVRSALPAIERFQRSATSSFPIRTPRRSQGHISEWDVWAFLEMNDLTLDSYRLSRPERRKMFTITTGNVQFRSTLPDPMADPIEAMRQAYQPQTYDEWKTLHTAWRSVGDFSLPEPVLTLPLVVERHHLLVRQSGRPPRYESRYYMTGVVLRDIEKDAGLPKYTFAFTLDKGMPVDVAKWDARYRDWQFRMTLWKVGLTDDGPPGLDTDIIMSALPALREEQRSIEPRFPITTVSMRPSDIKEQHVWALLEMNGIEPDSYSISTGADRGITITTGVISFLPPNPMLEPIEALRSGHVAATYDEWRHLFGAWRDHGDYTIAEPQLTFAMVVERYALLADRPDATENELIRQMTGEVLRVIERENDLDQYTFDLIRNRSLVPADVVRWDAPYREWQIDLIGWRFGSREDPPPELDVAVIRSALPSIKAQQRDMLTRYPITDTVKQDRMVNIWDLWAFLEANDLEIGSYTGDRPGRGQLLAIRPGTVQFRSENPWGIGLLGADLDMAGLDLVADPAEAVRRGYVPQSYDQWRILHRAWRGLEDAVHEPALTLDLVKEKFLLDQRGRDGSAQDAAEQPLTVVSPEILRVIERENDLDPYTFDFIGQGRRLIGVQRWDAKYVAWQRNVLDWQLGLSGDLPPMLDVDIVRSALPTVRMQQLLSGTWKFPSRKLSKSGIYISPDDVRAVLKANTLDPAAYSMRRPGPRQSLLITALHVPSILDLFLADLDVPSEPAPAAAQASGRKRSRRSDAPTARGAKRPRTQPEEVQVTPPDPIELLRQNHQPSTYPEWKVLYAAWRATDEALQQPRLTMAIAADAHRELRGGPAAVKYVDDDLLRDIEKANNIAEYTFDFGQRKPSRSDVVVRDALFRDWLADLAATRDDPSRSAPELTAGIVRSALPIIVRHQQLTVPEHPIVLMNKSLKTVTDADVMALLELAGLEPDSYHLERTGLSQVPRITTGRVRFRAHKPDLLSARTIQIRQPATMPAPLDALRQRFQPRTYEEFKALYAAWKAAEDPTLPKPVLTFAIVFDKSTAMAGGPQPSLMKQLASMTDEVLRVIEQENGIAPYTFELVRDGKQPVNVAAWDRHYRAWQQRLATWAANPGTEAPDLTVDIVRSALPSILAEHPHFVTLFGVKNAGRPLLSMTQNDVRAVMRANGLKLTSYRTDRPKHKEPIRITKGRVELRPVVSEGTPGEPMAGPSVRTTPPPVTTRPALAPDPTESATPAENQPAPIQPSPPMEPQLMEVDSPPTLPAAAFREHTPDAVPPPDSAPAPLNVDHADGRTSPATTLPSRDGLSPAEVHQLLRDGLIRHPPGGRPLMPDSDNRYEQWRISNAVWLAGGGRGASPALTTEVVREAREALRLDDIKPRILPDDLRRIEQDNGLESGLYFVPHRRVLLHTARRRDEPYRQWLADLDLWLADPDARPAPELTPEIVAASVPPSGGKWKNAGAVLDSHVRDLLDANRLGPFSYTWEKNKQHNVTTISRRDVTLNQRALREPDRKYAKWLTDVNAFRLGQRDLPDLDTGIVSAASRSVGRAYHSPGLLTLPDLHIFLRANGIARSSYEVTLTSLGTIATITRSGGVSAGRLAVETPQRRGLSINDLLAPATAETSQAPRHPAAAAATVTPPGTQDRPQWFESALRQLAPPVADSTNVYVVMPKTTKGKDSVGETVQSFLRLVKNATRSLSDQTFIAVERTKNLDVQTIRRTVRAVHMFIASGRPAPVLILRDDDDRLRAALSRAGLNVPLLHKMRTKRLADGWRLVLTGSGETRMLTGLDLATAAAIARTTRSAVEQVPAELAPWFFATTGTDRRAAPPPDYHNDDHYRLVGRLADQFPGHRDVRLAKTEFSIARAEAPAEIVNEYARIGEQRDDVDPQGARIEDDSRIDWLSSTFTAIVRGDEDLGGLTVGHLAELVASGAADYDAAEGSRTKKQADHALFVQDLLTSLDTLERTQFDDGELTKFIDGFRSRNRGRLNRNTYLRTKWRKKIEEYIELRGNLTMGTKAAILRLQAALFDC